MSNCTHWQYINNYYMDIVSALHNAMISCVPVTNPLNELAIIRLKTSKAFHTFLQAEGRASQQACVT